MNSSNKKLQKTQKIIINNEIAFSLVRKAREKYYCSLDKKNVTDNKTFQVTVKPFPSDKKVNSQKRGLVEKNEIITNEEYRNFQYIFH